MLPCGYIRRQRQSRSPSRSRNRSTSSRLAHRRGSLQQVVCQVRSDIAAKWRPNKVSPSGGRGRAWNPDRARLLVRSASRFTPSRQTLPALPRSQVTGPKFVLRGLVRRNSVKTCASVRIIRIPQACIVWRYVFKTGPIIGIVSLCIIASTMINMPRIVMPVVVITHLSYIAGDRSWNRCNGCGT